MVYLATCKPTIIFKNDGQCEFLEDVQQACNIQVTSSNIQTTAAAALFSMASPIWKVDTSLKPCHLRLPELVTVLFSCS